MAGRFGGRPGYFARRTRSAETVNGESDDRPADVGSTETSEIDDLFAALDFGEEETEAPEPLIVQPAAETPAPEPASVSHLLTEGVLASYGLSRPPTFDLTPRPYQEEAISSWSRQGGRGVIVLPTGAGKTVVALIAAARLGLRTLVVAPTIELLHQWRAALSERLGYPLWASSVAACGRFAI
jgi:hypothetical protein